MQLRKLGTQRALRPWLRSRFPALSGSEITRLSQHTARAVAAGDEVFEGGPDFGLGGSEVPINPRLFGDDPAGNRVRYGVEIEWYDPVTDRGGFRYLEIDAESGQDLNDLDRIARQTLEGQFDQSEPVEGFGGSNQVEMDITQIVFAERRY